jgi:hypothetical protein
MIPATPRKDDESYFTDTIRMRTKILSASTTKYNIILPEMRRQTLRKPRSSTRHHHRSSTLTNAIQMRQKTLLPTAAPAAPYAAALLFLSLSLALSFFPLFSLSNVDDTYYTASRGALNDLRQSSAMKRERERERERGRASEASSLCEPERERASEASSLCERESEREREEREGEKQERPVAACGARLLTRTCVVE